MSLSQGTKALIGLTAGGAGLGGLGAAATADPSAFDPNKWTNFLKRVGTGAAIGGAAGFGLGVHSNIGARRAARAAEKVKGEPINPFSSESTGYRSSKMPDYFEEAWRDAQAAQARGPGYFDEAVRAARASQARGGRKTYDEAFSQAFKPKFKVDPQAHATATAAHRAREQARKRMHDKMYEDIRRKMEEEAARMGGAGAAAASAKVIPGLGGATTKREAKTLYREMMMKAHPDRGGSTTAAQRVNAAWQDFQPQLAKLGAAAALAEFGL